MFTKTHFLVAFKASKIDFGIVSAHLLSLHIVHSKNKTVCIETPCLSGGLSIDSFFWGHSEDRTLWVFILDTMINLPRDTIYSFISF